ncbi:hypothetical protein D0865_05944 [Hortaea werneckii]|uniref:Uncharacterized protein n=1 Tax=Hortaea werneckii TaxID=91943 RepID=A0A3M7CJ75_HORWE|nr:hypothetical protein D0865_05944 [Hortaea werneckii]
MRQSQKNKQKSADKDVVKTEPDRKRKDDLIASLPPVEESGKDLISSLPTETFHEILSYLILDHDPNRGLKLETLKRRGFKDQPHVFLSLSVLSKHFRNNVESFCLHHLTQFKEIYGFQPAAQMDAEHRRSARLAAKPKKDSRIFRVLLVKHLQTRCIHCNFYCWTRATMATGVACCLWDHAMKHCEEDEFPTTVVSSGESAGRPVSADRLQTISHAMNVFDLRDYMLLKSRSPGPRAKHLDLPSIPYGTVRVNLGCGKTIASYRFFHHDVLKIARMVHGSNLLDHLRGKRRQRHIRLGIRYWIACQERTRDKSKKEAYQKKIDEARGSIQKKNWQDLCKLHPTYDYHCPISNCEVCAYGDFGGRYPDY